MDNFISHVRKAVNQIIVKIRRLVQIRELDELELSFEITGSDSKENRKQKRLRQPGRATQAVRGSSVNRIFITVESERPTRYEEDELGISYDCYIAEGKE